MLVVQPAQDRHHNGLRMGARPGLGGRVWHRDALPEALVRPRPIEVAHVLREDAAEVPLTEEQDRPCAPSTTASFATCATESSPKCHANARRRRDRIALRMTKR